LSLRGRVSALDGSSQIEVNGQSAPADAQQLGRSLAGDALEQGAAKLLEVAQ